MSRQLVISHFFFFNDTATTEIYTLSLHDALPILPISTARTTRVSAFAKRIGHNQLLPLANAVRVADRSAAVVAIRSEEHTSELQSQSNLVCRLLLEKKKTHTRCPIRNTI